MDEIMDDLKDELVQPKNSQPNFRVKVYLLNASGNWEDCGTGTLEMVKDAVNDEELDFFQVLADNEQDKSTLSPELLEKQAKITNNKTNERYVLYRPLLKTSQFENQGGKFKCH